MRLDELRACLMKKPPVCPYCNREAELKTGREVYSDRRDLRNRWVWVCEPCDARVGCHSNTKTPLGRLADAKLRKAKKRAHAAFDQLWKGRHMTRANAYRWLANKLGIDVRECHIGHFDVETCYRVCDVVRTHNTEKGHGENRRQDSQRKKRRAAKRRLRDEGGAGSTA